MFKSFSGIVCLIITIFYYQAYDNDFILIFKKFLNALKCNAVPA